MISGGKLFTQVSQFDILEDELISVGVEYDFNYNDISSKFSNANYKFVCVIGIFFPIF